MRSELLNLLSADVLNRISAIAQLPAHCRRAWLLSEQAACGGRACSPNHYRSQNLVRIGADNSGFVVRFGSRAHHTAARSRGTFQSACMSSYPVSRPRKLLAERSVLYWVAYPFLQVYHAGAVWHDFSLHWRSLLLPFYSVGLLLWALRSMLLLYTVAFGALFKTAVVAVEQAGKWLTPERINLLLFLTFPAERGLGVADVSRLLAVPPNYTAQENESRQMPLSEFERERIEKLFGEYCRGKVPPHVRDKIRIEYKVRGSEVKLFECRPRFDDPSTWTEMPVARFKKDEKEKTLGFCTARIETENGISSNQTQKTKTLKNF